MVTGEDEVCVLTSSLPGMGKTEQVARLSFEKGKVYVLISSEQFTEIRGNVALSNSLLLVPSSFLLAAPSPDIGLLNGCAS